MSDMTQLVSQLAPFLAPLLPYLLKAGEKAAEEAGKKLGGDAWERAKALWAKLRRKERVAQAAQDLAESPDDDDAQAALRLQLKKVLQADPSLAAEVAAEMQAEVVQQVLAERGSWIGDVEQQAQGGPTRQEVVARDESTIQGVRQTRKP
jgi:hypothetical protein